MNAAVGAGLWLVIGIVLWCVAWNQRPRHQTVFAVCSFLAILIVFVVVFGVLAITGILFLPI